MAAEETIESMMANHNQSAEPDSDPEDDPGKMLNVWLSQLNQKVKLS